MCPYYDYETGMCKISKVYHHSNDCKDANYWRTCPNYEKRRDYGVY